MSSHPPSIVSNEQIRRYQSDGVILLSNVFASSWLDQIAQGIDEAFARPSKRSITYASEPERNAEFFYDARILGEVGAFDRFMLHSPMGKVAARLMGSSAAMLFYISVFVRTRGTRTRTPWHQDQVDWSATGEHACSVWVPLDPVPRETALEFVRGSHRWSANYERPDFFHNRHQEDIKGLHQPFPDIEANRNVYDIVGWEMNPGDCLVFHGMTVHGGSGDLPTSLGRRAVSVQWVGDDARYRVHPGGADPDISEELEAHGLRHGDPLVCDMCPVVWPSLESSIE